MVLSGFALLLLTGEYARQGPILLSLSATHGVHRGDVAVVLGWALGMAGLAFCLVGRPVGTRSGRSR